jgi:hypothetical protein
MNYKEYGERLLRLLITAGLGFVFVTRKFSSFSKLYIAIYAVYVVFSIIIMEACIKLTSING